MSKLKMSDDAVVVEHSSSSSRFNNDTATNNTSSTTTSLQPQPSFLHTQRTRLQHAAIVMLFTFMFVSLHLALHLFFWRHQSQGITLHGWIVVILVGFVLGALVIDVSADVLMLFCCVVVSIVGIISVQHAFVGFANTSLLAIAFLFPVSRVLSSTGVVDVLVRPVFGKSQRLYLLLPRMMAITCLLSSCLNNAPVVSMLIPAVQQLSHRTSIAPSQFLMPLSFAAIVGGLLSIIGCSSNLMVLALTREVLADVGVKSFQVNLFEIALLGLPLCGICIVYCTLATRLLPSNPLDETDIKMVRLRDNESLLNDDNNNDDEDVDAPPRQQQQHHAETVLWKKVVVAISALCIVALNAAGVIDLVNIGIIATIVYLSIGVLTLNEAKQAVNANVMLTVMAAVGLSNAIVASGVASLWATAIVRVFAGTGNVGALYAIYVAATLLTLLVTNAAAAAIALPMAIEIGAQLSIPIKSVMYVTMIGAASCFMSHIGYQTNLMVMTPGRYTFRDFVKFGSVLQILLLIFTPILTALIFGTDASECDLIRTIAIPSSFNETLCSKL